MSQIQRLSGVWSPITTPFSNGEIDTSALRLNLDKYRTSSLRGYFALGSNGESCFLERREQARVLQTIVSAKGSGQLVMAGCTHESPRESIELAKTAADLGADIASVLPPHYFKKHMTDSALLHFFETVADNSPIPVVLYNAPGFANGISLSAKTVGQLSIHPNIIGIKDSSPAGPNILLAELGETNFSVLAGSLNFLLSSMSMGTCGGVLSAANYVPRICCTLYSLISTRQREARHLQQSLIRLNRRVSGKYGVAGVKAAMDAVGLRGGEPRLPLLPLNESQKEEISEAMHRFFEETIEYSPPSG